MNELKENKISTKESILKATIEIIREEGPNKITVRQIASKANTNIALIKYYFGSKEKLIGAVIASIVEKMEVNFLLLEDKEIKPRQRLKDFLLNHIKMMKENSNIIRMTVANDFLEFDSQVEFIEYLRKFGFNQVKKVFFEITGNEKEEVLTFMMLQIMGATIFPILALPLILDAEKFDIAFEENLGKYIETLLDNYLGIYKSNV